MDKRVLWLCVLAGSTIGSLLPEAWGAGAFGAASLLFGAVGGLAGVWLAVRIDQSL